MLILFPSIFSHAAESIPPPFSGYFWSKRKRNFFFSRQRFVCFAEHRGTSKHPSCGRLFRLSTCHSIIVGQHWHAEVFAVILKVPVNPRLRLQCFPSGEPNILLLLFFAFTSMRGQKANPAPQKITFRMRVTSRLNTGRMLGEHSWTRGFLVDCCIIHSK